MGCLYNIFWNTPKFIALKKYLRLVFLVVRLETKCLKYREKTTCTESLFLHNDIHKIRPKFPKQDPVSALLETA